ncbi:hypothetical protein JW906_09015 [bacterium]|nr:hypothetical protein [bacterium]
MRIQKLKIIPCALFTLFLWANYHIGFKTHYHFRPDGRMVVHYHPCQNDNKENKPIPSHTHSPCEYFLLDVVFKTLSFFLPIIFLLWEGRHEIRSPLQTPKYHFESVIPPPPQGRGPPFLSHRGDQPATLG